jgi:hypothetical protein
MSLVSYLSQVALGLESELGSSHQLGRLLSLEDPKGPWLHALDTGHKGLAAKVQQFLPSSATWAELVLGHLRVCKAYHQPSRSSHIQEAYQQQNTNCQVFLQMYAQLSKRALPLLYTLLKDLRHLAILADRVSSELNSSNVPPGNTGKGARNLEEACRTMNRAFSYCVTDRLSPLESSRKWGTYHVAGLLFKTYFRVLLLLSPGDSAVVLLPLN